VTDGPGAASLVGGGTAADLAAAYQAHRLATWRAVTLLRAAVAEPLVNAEALDAACQEWLATGPERARFDALDAAEVPS
jgi:hypothetical protein